MSTLTPGFSVESLKMLSVVAFLMLTADLIVTGTGFVAALSGTVLIVVLGLVALPMGWLTPLDPPAFAYVMAPAFAFALPFSPVQAPFLAAVGEIDSLATTTPTLAYAGLSIGLQTGKMKEVSWKPTLAVVFVFLGTSFGSVLISQTVLFVQGTI